MEIVALLQAGVTKPHVDDAVRASWLGAAHAATRGVSAAVEGPAVGRNYYRVDVPTGSILLNAAVLLVAAADTRELPLRFASVPRSGVFSEHGFHVACPQQLNEPLSERHLRALAADERRDVAYHGPARLGDLFFNWFD